MNEIMFFYIKIVTLYTLYIVIAEDLQKSNIDLEPIFF